MKCTKGQKRRAPKHARTEPSLLGPLAKRRVLVVDDHPMTIEGLTAIINRQADLVVCCQAGNPAKAMAALSKLNPDLMVTDITMPGRSGIEFIKDVHAILPDLPILVLSMHDEMLYAERTLRAGARGYLMKDVGGEELLKAIGRVLEGHVYLSPAMTEILLDVIPGRHSVAADSVTAQLTDREFQVFQCLGHGMASREIGAQLHMSVKTVETHRRHVREKLNLNTGPELIKFAVRWGSSQPSS
jgi:DNA-binding NarL/FixJ family response regulator